MTKKQLQRVTWIVVGTYFTALLVGIILRMAGPPTPTPYYETFKDLIPFLLVIPATYWGYCFQQRTSYLASLRTLWSNLVFSVNEAIQFTFEDEPTQKDYGQILTSLSIVIDELRGVYMNVGEIRGKTGLYPYEPIKCIHQEIKELGWGKLDKETSAAARKNIIGYWKSIRESFLSEFDRAEPSRIVSPYIKK